MELVPWKPFGGLTPFRREIDDLLERFLGERAPIESREGWVPALDVLETKNAVVVNVEIPGMETKDIDISLSGDLLIIKGEKKQEKEEKDENYYRVERSYGSFSRSIRVSVDVKSDEIQANYKNGTLKITLPKKEEIKPKTIKVDAG